LDIYYEGKNITAHVDAKKCIHKDVSGGARDMLDIEFELSGRWYGWQPKGDDRIRIEAGGYSTGDMYLNTVLPNDGKYRIIATSAKLAARQKAWASYEHKTLSTIMAACAGECGMKSSLYGISENIQYPYIIRENEESTGFLDRLLRLEGACLKCFNGKMRGISIEYAQRLSPTQTIEINADQKQAFYINRKDLKYTSLTIQARGLKSSALDDSAEGSNHKIITTLPVFDASQARRWARGLLLMHNRMAEALELGMEFNAGLTALARIDIESKTDMDGKWMIDEVEHDFINQKSKATLRRVITTIR